MEIDIEKYTMLKMKTEPRETKEKIKLLKQKTSEFFDRRNITSMCEY